MRNKQARNLLIVVLAVVGLGVCGSQSYAAIAFTLTISPSSITFPDANPSSVAQIPGSATVLIKVRVTNGANQNWSVHLLANGDLLNSDGVSKIPIANLTWTSTMTGNACANGCTCVPGTMSSTVPQDVIRGLGNTPTGQFNCNTSFSLKNQWGYNTGSYNQTITVVTASP
ncbi:MAG: hypothetical protein ACHQKY_01470 [Terriglobia bacterium]